jgi:hypothetical protein
LSAGKFHFEPPFTSFDHLAGELAKEPVRRAGIGYELAAKHKSELYADPFLPMLNARKITLPRHERAISQICALERSLQRSGREQITHPIHGHDDCANSIAGAVDLVYSHFGYDRLYRAFSDAPAQQQPTSSADQRLHDFYRSLDFGFSHGLIRGPWP